MARRWVRAANAWGLVCSVACAIGCAAGSPPVDHASAGDDDTGGGWSGGSSTTAEGGAGGAHGTGGSGTCTYPVGEIGVLEGMVVDGTLGWTGFLAGGDVEGALSTAELFDCDGTKGINAILIVESATWCAPCAQEAGQLQAEMDGGWSALGIRVVELMVQDASEQPATIDTATSWKQAFGLHDVAVGADPAFSFDYFDFDQHISGGYFPTAIVVDPRSMTIVARQPGPEQKDLHAAAEALAASNQ